MSGEQPPDNFRREVDGGHGTVAGEGKEGLGAEGADTGRIGEGEDAGDVRGGDLAL